MRKVWNSLIQCHLDYGSILWAPVSGIINIRNMEAQLRAYTKKAKGMYYLNYFKLLSNQRRSERYKIIYISKSLNGIVPSLGQKWNFNQSRSGPQLVIRNPQGPSESIKSLDRDSLSSFRVKLYNSLPANLWLFEGEFETFKVGVDKFLELCPYEPRTETLISQAKDTYGKIQTP